MNNLFLSLCLLSRGKYYFKTSVLLSSFHLPQLKVPEPWPAKWELSGASSTWVLPFSQTVQGNFCDLLSLKSPLMFLFLERSQSDPLGCSAVVTGSSSSLLCHFEPVSVRLLSLRTLGTWGEAKFQPTASPVHCGWRIADQEELQARLKSIEKRQDLAIQSSPLKEQCHFQAQADVSLTSGHVEQKRNSLLHVEHPEVAATTRESQRRLYTLWAQVQHATGHEDWAETQDLATAKALAFHLCLNKIQCRQWVRPVKLSHSPCDPFHIYPGFIIAITTHVEDTKQDWVVIY